MMRLYKLFLDKDATMLEINPMVEDTNKQGDCHKIGIFVYFHCPVLYIHVVLYILTALMSRFAIKVCLRGWVRVGLGRVRVG